MIEGESKKNHVAAVKRGHDSAECVDPAHERLFESTDCLLMVEGRQKAQTCKSDVRWLPAISFNSNTGEKG